MVSVSPGMGSRYLNDQNGKPLENRLGRKRGWEQQELAHTAVESLIQYFHFEKPLAVICSVGNSVCYGTAFPLTCIAYKASFKPTGNMYKNAHKSIICNNPDIETIETSNYGRDHWIVVVMEWNTTQ